MKPALTFVFSLTGGLLFVGSFLLIALVGACYAFAYRGVAFIFGLRRPVMPHTPWRIRIGFRAPAPAV